MIEEEGSSSSSSTNQHSSSRFISSDNERGIILIGPTVQYVPHRPTWSRSANLDVVDLTGSDEIDYDSASSKVDEDSKIRNLMAEDPQVEPFLQRLDCPVCMESFLSILKNGNKLMSTICGHAFCQSCLTSAIKASRKCPACRELLHLNSKSKQYVHRLYLPITLCKVSAS